MSQYLEALRQAMVIYPMIVVLFTVPYITWSYHKYGSVLSLRVLIVYSFLLYLLCVYCLVILPLPTPEKAATLQGHKMQLIPFSFLADIVKQAEIQPEQPASWLHIFTGSAFWTTVFNLFMTMPFGVYLRYYFCSTSGTPGIFHVKSEAPSVCAAMPVSRFLCRPTAM